MAHTAVAATVYPLLMAIYALYEDPARITKFGRGLFTGMVYVAGAGSIVTLLGAARGAVAIGFYNDVVGREISFFEITYYMWPVGWLMVFLLWGYFMIVCKPERARIPGLRDRAKKLYASLGPMSGQEILALTIVVGSVAAMSMRTAVPWMAGLDKAAIILTATVLFFVFKILTIDDLEEIPWNIILLFGGAMSIGFCLWQTGAAKWMAVQWLVMFEQAPWFVFVMAVVFLVLILTNVIMNVAAIAITLPVALVLAGYLSVAPEVILFSSLVAAGMPFLLLVGAAPNAIAHGSKQFTSGQFFTYGVPASIILMIVIGLFVWFIWPLMGMPLLAQ
jgi:sodium-dependent dicarboxylate transporter 2/3/5